MNNTTPSMSDLAGQVVWHARGAQHGLHNQRPDLVGRIAPGRTASSWPQLVSSLLSMCGHAHHLTARLALDAACGHTRKLRPDEHRALQLDTLREHLRRLWLDWPRLWPAQAGTQPLAAATLQSAPVMRGPLSLHTTDADAHQALLQTTRLWLAEHALGMAPEPWLQHWHEEGEAWLAHWCRHAGTAPACWLLAVQASAQTCTAALQPWWPDDEVALRTLAHDLQQRPDAWRQPRWAPSEQAASTVSTPATAPETAPEAGPETGPWCRLRDRTHLPPGSTRSAWWRLASRLAEIATLSLADAQGCDNSGHALLRHQALSLGQHGALAWVEMARGTLLHWVQLDHDGPDARLQAARVLAPTEWNFCAHGPVARCLAGLPDPTPADAPSLHALVAAAWDPCVPFVVTGDTPHPQPQEQAHA